MAKRTDTTNQPTTTGRAPTVKVDHNDAGEWWWRLVAGNGQVECVSETYDGRDARRNAVRAARRHVSRYATPPRVLVRDGARFAADQVQP